MAIPDFQSTMLPILCHLADGQSHPNREVLDALADQFGLSADERSRLLPSGLDFVFRNRVAWARTHMKAAGLISSPQRGVFVLTDAGKALLASDPPRVDLKLLQTFESYRAFRSRHRGADDGGVHQVEASEDATTPEERIEEAHEILRERLANQILEQLKACSSAFFERVVVEVLVQMGYGGSRRDAGEAIGKSGDEGIDGIIKEDRLGLDIIYVQAKKWDSAIPRPEVQKFAGALQGKRARKGVFITTGEFTGGAIEFAAAIESKIILIDGRQLAKLMIDHGVGVTTEATYQLKRIDSDYFAEG